MDLASLDLNLLLTFEALFEERGVTAAARRIGIGQPGMSAALARLRVLLGDELFVRAAGQMRPTAKAVALAPGIMGALMQLRRTLQAEIGFDPATARRSFVVGSTDYASLVLLPSLMGELSRRAPGVDLRVVGYDKSAAAELLDRGEVDVAIGVFADPPERAVMTPLFEDCFVGVARAGHPAIAAGRIDAQTYAGLSHALVTIRRDVTGVVDDVLAEAGLKRRIILTLPHMMALPLTLAASDLVAALPSRIARDLAPAAHLQNFALPVDTRPWTVAMLWSASARGDPALAWLRHLIAGCAASLGPFPKGNEPS